MTGPGLEFEQRLWQAGFTRLAGVDEAGRGPLAGPVVAAAVWMAPDFLEREAAGLLAGLDDSKKLTERRREHFLAVFASRPEIALSAGSAEQGEIDAVNILNATHLAMSRAVSGLVPAPDHVLVDGRAVPGLPCGSTPIVRGDARSLLIAAASVVAKVTRDRHMVELDRIYPRYGFASHKGYGSQAHIRALFEYGPCPEHRRSFRPVREAAALKARGGTRQ